MSKALLALAALALFLPPEAALAGDGVPIEGLFAANFTLTVKSPLVFDVTANGIGFLSNVGNSSFQLQKTLDATSGVPLYAGTFTITAVSGDTLTGTYNGVGAKPDSGGYGPFSGVLTVTGGTGRFAGASGSVAFTAFSNGGTGQAVYSFKGVVSI
jgi:hypothetical protein